MAIIPTPASGKTNVEEILKGVSSGLVYRVDGDPRNEFLKELQSHGLDVKSLVLGKITRVKDAQDKGTSKSGWYIFNLLEDKYRSGEQFGVGSYGSWHGSPPNTNWCSKFEQALDLTEQEQYREQIAEMRARQEQETETRYQETAKESEAMMSAISATKYVEGSSSSPVIKHPYILKKKIIPYGAFLNKENNEIIIPLYTSDSSIASYQRINTDGKKLFAAGGRTKGCFFTIGDISDNSTPVVVAEGFATACSIHEATGYPVYAAFSANNMLNVANLVRSRHPKQTIIIAADNDQFSSNGVNAGKSASEAAASLCDGHVAIPQFRKEHLDKKPTDFNDLHALYGLDAVDWTINNAIPKQNPLTVSEKKQTDKGVSQNFIYPRDGIVSETVRWIIKTAQKPQPELALMNTIVALGAVFGRRYRTVSNLRTNIYFVGIAGTGSGKDHSRKCIKLLLERAGMDYFIGSDDFVSGAGLLTSLKNNPSQIMNFDELGEKYQIANQQNAGGYIKQGIVTITRLFSDAASTHDAGNYADENRRKKVKVVQPNLCIFGTSTMESYAATLKSSFVENGMLNRFLAMKVTHDIPKRNRGAVPPDEIPENLLAAWKALKPINYTAEPYAAITTVPFDDEAQAFFDDLGDMEDELVKKNNNRGAMWNRYREHITKLALIFSIAESPMHPTITIVHMRDAQSLVDSCMEFIMGLMTDYMHDSEFERQTKKALRLIAKGKNGLPRSELLRMMSMKAKELDEVVTVLVQMNKIEAREGEAPRAGFKPVVYFPCQAL